ncbi:MAG: class I SAM-dependent methyltransferase [Desulfovermiculus sp.]|nr:class I SAM-dependent methyltransferase [Desulfovermiculus sp.]
MTDSPGKGQAFARKMTDILNYGALNLAMGLGYRTGLFDALDNIGRPAPIEHIAKQTGLSERYIREWLGVMVCGRVVELFPGEEGEDLYFLPPEHADLITKRAGQANMGVYTQEIPLLAQSAYECVAQGFLTGQGVSFDHYPDFQEFMAQLAEAKHRQTLVDSFLPSVAKGRIIDRLHSGIQVCDLGCGRGTAVLLMAQAFPASRFMGLDIDAKALSWAGQEAEKLNLDNVQFVFQDAADLSGDEQWQDVFDYVTAFDAIHDQSHPLSALRGIRAMLKPDGILSMVDIAASSRLADNADHPMGPFLYTVSLMHCMPVGLVDNGAGLGMMWGRQKAVAMLEEAGFVDIAVREIPDDPFNLHFECKKAG